MMIYPTRGKSLFFFYKMMIGLAIIATTLITVAGPAAANRDIIFLVDNSGTMRQSHRDPHGQINNILSEFIRKIGPSDRAGVVTIQSDGHPVGDDARVILDLQSLEDLKRQYFTERLNEGLHYNGQWTVFHRAFEKAYKQFIDYETFKMNREAHMIVISDGLPDRGTLYNQTQIGHMERTDLERTINLIKDSWIKYGSRSPKIHPVWYLTKLTSTIPNYMERFITASGHTGIATERILRVYQFAGSLDAIFSRCSPYNRSGAGVNTGNLYIGIRTKGLNAESLAKRLYKLESRYFTKGITIRVSRKPEESGAFLPTLEDVESYLAKRRINGVLEVEMEGSICRFRLSTCRSQSRVKTIRAGNDIDPIGDILNNFTSKYRDLEAEIIQKTVPIEYKPVMCRVDDSALKKAIALPGGMPSDTLPPLSRLFQAVVNVNTSDPIISGDEKFKQRKTQDPFFNQKKVVTFWLPVGAGFDIRICPIGNQNFSRGEMSWPEGSGFWNKYDPGLPLDIFLKTSNLVGLKVSKWLLDPEHDTPIPAASLPVDISYRFSVSAQFGGNRARYYNYPLLAGVAGQTLRKVLIPGVSYDFKVLATKWPEEDRYFWSYTRPVNVPREKFLNEFFQKVSIENIANHSLSVEFRPHELNRIRWLLNPYGGNNPVEAHQAFLELLVNKSSSLNDYLERDIIGLINQFGNHWDIKSTNPKNLRDRQRLMNFIRLGDAYFSSFTKGRAGVDSGTPGCSGGARRKFGLSLRILEGLVRIWPQAEDLTTTDGDLIRRYANMLRRMHATTDPVVINACLNPNQQRRLNVSLDYLFPSGR